jgi:hypothetical protein
MMGPDMDSKRRPPIINIVDPLNPPNNPSHINLTVQIHSLYGRETLDEIRLMEKLRVKIQRRVADLEYPSKQIKKMTWCAPGRRRSWKDY